MHQLYVVMVQLIQNCYNLFKFRTLLACLCKDLYSIITDLLTMFSIAITIDHVELQNFPSDYTNNIGYKFNLKHLLLLDVLKNTNLQRLLLRVKLK